MTHLEQRPPRDRDRLAAPAGPSAAGRDGPAPAAVWTVVGIVAIALAAGAGGAVWFPREGDIDQSAALGRGLLFGVAGGAIALVAALALRRRYPLPRALLICLVVAVSSFAAMLGAATAPPTPTAAPYPPPASAPPVSEPGPLSEFGDIPFSKNAAASLVDADGDGRPDLDANGDPVIAFDADGDGTFERRLVRCPASTATESSGDPAVRLDLGCDGSIDGTVPLRAEMLDELPGVGRAAEGDLVPVNPDFGDDPAPSAPDGETGAEESGDDTGDDGSRLGAVGRVLLTLLAVAALAAIAVVVVRLLQARTPAPSWPAADPDDAEPEALDAAAVDAALGDSIATLLGHPDPRLAVRAAYAVLLDALAESGLARRSFEAPDEHLGRCLTSLNIEPAPLRDLLRLFALARFSTHPITEADRAAALGALRASQDLLRSRAATGVAASARGWGPPGSPR